MVRRGADCRLVSFEFSGGLGSRWAGALRFLDKADDRVVGCRDSEDSVGEVGSAASLAEERVTLEDMSFSSRREVWISPQETHEGRWG